MRLKLENNSPAPALFLCRADFRFAASVWLLSRLFIAFFAHAGHLSHPFREAIPGGFSGVSHWWLNVWTTYDTEHFFAIAQNGYTAKTSAFFPLYPLLLKPFAFDQNAMALAGVVVSNAAFFGALALFLSLSRHQLGEELGRKSVWILAFFPSAVYSMAVYTEAVFLLFLLSALWFARQNRWILAALFGVLAALTRNAGPILAAALLVEWFLQRRAPRASSEGVSAPWTALCALAPLAAFVGMQLYFRDQFGSVALLAAQQEFGRAFSWPWLPIWRDLLHSFEGNLNLVTLLNVIASVAVFVLAWKHRRRLAAPDLIFMCGVMLMQLLFSRIWPPYTISSLRYVLTTPAFSQAIALEFEARSTKRVKLFLQICALLLCAAISFLFGLKAFVS